MNQKTDNATFNWIIPDVLKVDLHNKTSNISSMRICFSSIKPILWTNQLVTEMLNRVPCGGVFCVGHLKVQTQKKKKKDKGQGNDIYPSSSEVLCLSSACQTEARAEELPGSGTDGDTSIGWPSMFALVRLLSFVIETMTQSSSSSSSVSA